MDTLIETRLPHATRDVERAERDLAEHGVAILEGVLSKAELQELRETLYRVAEVERRSGRAEAAYMSEHGTQRIWNLPSRDPIFCDLAEHPTALQLVKATLGWPALLSNLSANITEPGSSKMWMHADQQLNPLPWAGPHALNIIWCIDDFTDETGATRVVPGSHRLNRPPGADEQRTPSVALEAPAGSLVAMEGRVWHMTGANTSGGRRRAGVFGYYSLPMFVPQENWALSIDPAVRQFGSDILLQLMGLKGDYPMGRVNGRPLS